MDIQALLDKPTTHNRTYDGSHATPISRPPQRHRPEPHHTGGSCRCLCHTEQTQRLIALGLALFGGFSYLLGVLVGMKTPQRHQ
jgi:hypothetical protein